MIYILHGDDTPASYRRLVILKERFPKHQTINLNYKNTLEDFVMAVSATDLFTSAKIIIGQNLLGQKVITYKDLNHVPKETTVIFWELSKLPATLLRPFEKIATVEHFKPKAQIFYFLDSLKPGPNLPLKLLQKLDLSVETGVIWHLSQRTLQLVLAKLDVDLNVAQKITGRKIENWQWSKITNQAKTFSLDHLKALYHGTLKLDFMIKKGQTELDPKTLVSILLLKYLRA